uniref:Ricin B-type lectin domain-containing protein n=1 Tax=Thelazia callipaeda TaxID=103827 RepID=A0A0N5DCG9_THECL
LHLFFKDKERDEILEDLVTEYHKQRIAEIDFKKPAANSKLCYDIDGEKEKITLKGAACIFMLDVNSLSKVHVGAMRWNKIDMMKQSSERENNSLVFLASNGYFCSETRFSHIDDGECVQHTSLREYFVFCCCHTKIELCAYSASELTMKSVETNRKMWESKLEIRNPILADELRITPHDVRTSPWTYRDYIYSRPVKMG